MTLASLPSLELKYTKTTEKHDSNINTNTINNNIILSADKIPALNTSSSTKSLERSDTPMNIKQFKETLMTILIGYFKNNVILLNNLVELSEKIITKLSDLHLLISLLIDIPQDRITINVEEISVNNCCGKICKHLPRYRKITEIIIDNKQSFEVAYNQFYIQLQTEYNISLNYVLL
jgi:Ser-tRNA(Ala) deacylase AlaX